MREAWHTGNRHVGREVFVLGQADSTNALALADGRPGVAYLAGEQSSGRGTHGRAWHAPPWSSVLLTVVAPEWACRPPVLTAWAAVSVCRTVQEVASLRPRIKWPNDVLLHGKKLAGILIERSGAGPYVAGIGLNVRQREADFLAAGLPAATSLAAQGYMAEVEAVARALLAQLDAEMGRIADQGEQPLEAEWGLWLGLTGEVVRAECAGGTFTEGRVTRIGFNGVALETESGLVTLAPEGILHLDGRGW
jgi:BirA family biotin operon repressor/biotin-[acetyl-CoA-carboxylase] ligase